MSILLSSVNVLHISCDTICGHFRCGNSMYSYPNCFMHGYSMHVIKTHVSESRDQGGSTLRRPLDERT